MKVRAERVEQLAQELELIAEPRAQAVARELVQAVTELHVSGLERILAILSGSPCATLIEQLGSDPLVGCLLALHGLHPMELPDRVARAVELAQEPLAEHGAEAELLAVEDGDVRLRLRLHPQGCGSSSAISRAVLEDSIYDAAPDLASLSIEEITIPQSVFIPLEQLTAGTVA